MERAADALAKGDGDAYTTINFKELTPTGAAFSAQLDKYQKLSDDQMTALMDERQGAYNLVRWLVGFSLLGALVLVVGVHLLLKSVVLNPLERAVVLLDQVAITSGRSKGGSPRSFDAWTVRLLTSSGTDAPSTGPKPSYLDVTQLNSDTQLAGPGDGALSVNGYFTVAQSVQFSATSGAEFWLQSFVLKNGLSEPTLRVVGYRDGNSVAQ